MENKWYIKIIDKGYKLTREIYIFKQRFDGKAEMLDGTIFDSRDTLDIKPTLELNREQLQEFANTLNKLGISPKKEFLEGKLEATEKHLEDMRKLVFKPISS